MTQLKDCSINPYQRNTFTIGLTIALTSWSLVFLTLLWGYIFYRAKSASWLQGYIDPHIQLVAIFNTLVIALSSVSLRVGLKSRQSSVWLWSAFFLGVVFLLSQMQLWNLMISHGLDWRQTMSGSFFFLLTGFHALHILGALPALVMLALRIDAWKNSTFSTGVRCFWDLLLLIWVMLFVLIFVIQ